MNPRARLLRLERILESRRSRFGLLNHAKLRADLERLLLAEGDSRTTYPVPEYGGGSPRAWLDRAAAADTAEGQ